MSRLYGRKTDIYRESILLRNTNLKHYKKDKSKIDLEELADAPSTIEEYLPDNAIKLMESNRVHIIENPLCITKGFVFPEKKGDEPKIFFPRFTPIEEYKKELLFFFGVLLSQHNPDNFPDENTIPGEFGDVLALLLEYLYLKEKGTDEDFALKHLHELKILAKSYIRSYESYERSTDRASFLSFYRLSDEKRKMFDDNYAERTEEFIKDTLTYIVPFSSMEAILQIIDKVKDKEEFKALIEELVANENNDRQHILNEHGINSFGYPRLTKEIGRSAR